MKKKIDATENPSRLENASARALSADRSEQASRPGTFSTMMSDRVIFSSASARIVAAEQVKGNKIAAMKPGADTSLASAANWKTTNGSNLSFGNFHGKSCMKTVGVGSSAGVWLDYFEDAPLCSQGRLMATSVDVFAEAPAQVHLGAADDAESIVELAEYQVGRWIRISTVLRPTGMRNFQIYNNTSGAVVYFRNAKVEFFTSSPTLYTPQTQDNIWHADLEFPCGNNEFAEDGEPQPGDWIAQLGNRSDVKRQSAIVQEFASSGQFLIVWYDAVNSYSTTGKDRIHIGNGALDVVNMRANSLETDTLNVRSRIDAGTIVATGNITTKGTLTASKIEGDFPMDIPDDLEVNTVTASGTVKGEKGNFEVFTAGNGVIDTKVDGSGIVVSASDSTTVSLSPTLLDMKNNVNSRFRVAAESSQTRIIAKELPYGAPDTSFVLSLQDGQIFMDSSTEKDGTCVLRIKRY